MSTSTCNRTDRVEQRVASDLSRSAPEYELDGLLRRRGPLLVYFAYHRRTGRHVTLEVLPRPSRAARARFESDTRALARLVHPGFARVRDAGDAGRHVYRALDFVPGRSLASFGRLSQAAHAAVEARTRAALRHARRRGVEVLEPDPDDVLIGEDGALRIVHVTLAQPASDADVERGGVDEPRAPAANATRSRWRPRSPLFFWLGVSVLAFALGATLAALFA